MKVDRVQCCFFVFSRIKAVIKKWENITKNKKVYCWTTSQPSCHFKSVLWKYTHTHMHGRTHSERVHAQSSWLNDSLSQPLNLLVLEADWQASAALVNNSWAAGAGGGDSRRVLLFCCYIWSCQCQGRPTGRCIGLEDRGGADRGTPAVRW